MKKLSENIFWTGIFLILSTNVYLISECLQLSSWISNSSHYATTIYSYVYNLLYVWLLQFTLVKISNITSPKYPSIALYTIFYILGGLGFAILGEVPFLHNLAITPGFWGRLNGNAKVTIILGSIIFLMLGLRQFYIAIRNKDLCRHFVPYLLFLIFYGTTLSMLIISQTKMINVHVHHAICAMLLSFWFTDWTAKSSMITHAILMGVVVEGIDFYGIGELSLFLLNNSQKISIHFAAGIAATYFAISLIVLYFLAAHLKKREVISTKNKNNNLDYRGGNNLNSFYDTNILESNNNSPPPFRSNDYSSMG